MCGTKSCAILGHSPMRFAWGFDEEAVECHDMKMELAQQIMVLRQQGVTHFSVACDYGVGLYAAELINVLRDNDPELMLFCVTPYEEQATKWTPELRERYFDIPLTSSRYRPESKLSLRMASCRSQTYMKPIGSTMMFCSSMRKACLPERAIRRSLRMQP